MPDALIKSVGPGPRGFWGGGGRILVPFLIHTVRLPGTCGEYLLDMYESH